MSSQDSAPAIYQFRIWLRGISPTIWRRLLVRSDSTIADLHYILQPSWADGYAFHTFFIHGKDYGIYHSGDGSLTTTTVHLRDFQFRCTSASTPSTLATTGNTKCAWKKYCRSIPNSTIRFVLAVLALVLQKTAVVQRAFSHYKIISTWDTRCIARSSCCRNWRVIGEGWRKKSTKNSANCTTG